MFESLSDRLSGVFERLRGRGALNEADVRAAMREVRIALLEADVALPVVREFVDKATEQAVGQQVLRSVTPGQQVVKIVHDALVDMLGADASDLDVDVTPPAVVMMVGLQGSGKTTTTAKLANRLSGKDRKKVMMASLDVARPAAQEQLAVLGRQADVATLPIVPGQQPVEIARRALQSARLQGFDVLLLDTAGRLHVDQALMDEMKAVAEVSNPTEVLLVVDALTGQDAVNVARSFTAEVDLTGVVLTRLDGDARGGAALSVARVTGRQILFASIGEKLDDFDLFHPERMASRILGMGDVLTLIEQAERAFDADQAAQMTAKLEGGEDFTLEDFLSQMQAVRRMGSMSKLLGMLPGMGQFREQIDNLDERELDRVEAMIRSMTPQERADPRILNGSRRSRIARGSGMQVSDVNGLVDRFAEAQKMMRSLRNGGGLPGMPGLPGGSKKARAKAQNLKAQKRGKAGGKGRSGNPAKRALEAQAATERAAAGALPPVPADFDLPAEFKDLLPPSSR